MSPPGLMTADELLRTHLPDKKTELVRGILVVREPTGYRHGDVTARITKALMDVVDARGLGRVLAAETGFKLSADPDTVRAPDVAFVSRERVPDPAPLGYPALAPDLVIEVLSPGDRPGETLAKVGDWLTAGSRLVWVVDPGRREARVYRQDGSEAVLSETDVLKGEDVVPASSARSPRSWWCERGTPCAVRGQPSPWVNTLKSEPTRHCAIAQRCLGPPFRVWTTSVIDDTRPGGGQF